MNPLTHVKINHEVFKDQNLTQSEKEMLYLGSIIPDVSELNISTDQQTHHQGLQFLKTIDQKYFYFAAGIILHGESPQALDYLAHHDKGYINSKKKEVIKIIKQYKKPFGRKPDYDQMAHYLIEFAFDYLIIQKDPLVPHLLDRAVTNGMSRKAILNFANFYNVKQKELKTLIKGIRSKTIRKYIHDFKTLKGSAHNFQKFLFLVNLKSSKSGNFIGKFGKMATSSYGIFKKKLIDRQFVQMFERTVELLRKDHEEFTQKSIKHLKKLAKQHQLLK